MIEINLTESKLGLATSRCAKNPVTAGANNGSLSMAEDNLDFQAISTLDIHKVRVR